MNPNTDSMQPWQDAGAGQRSSSPPPGHGGVVRSFRIPPIG
jgi:hypothetical protein